MGDQSEQFLQGSHFPAVSRITAKSEVSESTKKTNPQKKKEENQAQFIFKETA